MHVYAVSQMVQNNLIFVEIIIVILQRTQFNVFWVLPSSKLEGDKTEAPSGSFVWRIREDLTIVDNDGKFLLECLRKLYSINTLALVWWGMSEGERVDIACKL